MCRQCTRTVGTVPYHDESSETESERWRDHATIAKTAKE
jgi:hypothetical protein